ncbi:MAG: hypothetical protein ACR2OA_20900 [Rubripirellula sp.]|jgi:hypothetical protein
MAQLSNFPNSTVLRNFVFLGACVLVCGCSETNSLVDTSKSPFVQVMYQGEPLGDVQVRLHETQGGPVIAQSVSRQDGNAYFSQVPSPEPAKYYVTVESLSDGSWGLNPQACQKLSESISLKALESSPAQRIDIPDGAVFASSSPKGN